MKENNYSKEIFIKSIKYLKGVGPKYAEILAKKNIITLYDLISFYPRTYDDRRKTLKIYEALQNQEKTSVVYVEVIDISSFTFQYRNKPLVIVTDGDVICEVPIYGGRLPAGIAKGAKLYLTGKFLRSGRGKIQCRVIEFEKPSSNALSYGKIVPIYPLTESFNSFNEKSLPFAGKVNDTSPEVVTIKLSISINSYKVFNLKASHLSLIDIKVSKSLIAWFCHLFSVNRCSGREII